MQSAWKTFFTTTQEREQMNRITDFLFETMQLKRIQRTGYQFLGPGNESVAEHTFCVMCVAWVLAQQTPEADSGHLMAMCLFHDLPEARMGDLNAVQKQYVTADEGLAVDHLIKNLPFGTAIKDLIDEFNTCETIEARLANDADQLAFLLDLKSLSDMGYATPKKWTGQVRARLHTDAGIELSEKISQTQWDGWWQKIFIDMDGDIQ